MVDIMNQIQAKNKEVLVKKVFDQESIKEQLSSLLQGNPRKMEAFKTRILQMSTTFGLSNCTPESIINCGLKALTLDLPLESGQGYIVNYGGTAQFDCGYKGWQVLAKRAGFSVQADVVYECDQFHQDGFGFDRKMSFVPDWSNRKGSDDKWAKDNLTGVIVSIREDATKQDTMAFVPADMILKIVGSSPSAGKKDKNGRMHSPHDNWAEQMFAAKAIKQVLSKFAIDIAESSQLAEAVEIMNHTESQAQVPAGPEPYTDERLDTNYHAWVAAVESGKRTAMSIITQLSNTYSLTEDQMSKVYQLINHEPIVGEVVDAEQQGEVEHSFISRMQKATTRDELDLLLADSDDPELSDEEREQIKAVHGQRVNELME